MKEDRIGTVRMINADCMEVMAAMPDKAFDLAIVDPPYGIDINSSGRICKEEGRDYKEWDKLPPPHNVFTGIAKGFQELHYLGCKPFH